MKNFLTVVALILVLVGALNWFLVGVFSFNLVDFVLGSMSVATRIIYGAVGIAGIWLLGATIFGNGRIANK